MKIEKDIKGQRILCWFSCGAPSLVAAKMAIETYGASNEVLVVCCDTRPSENSDNYRFSKAAEAYLGQPIVFIRNDKYATVDEVFERTGYMAGIAGARCTTELKKIPRQNFAKPEDIHVFGLTVDEWKRIHDFESRNPELRLLWILQQRRVSKQDAISLVRMEGIELPEMYRLGFDNNNCPGCVKASSPWYWDMVRTNFPEVFKRRCEQSRKLGVRLVEIRHHDRIFLDELPKGPFNKQKENLSCGPECGVQLDLLVS